MHKGPQSERVPRVIVSWWLAALQALLVRYVKISEGWVERVRAASSRGPVVFILRNRSLIDFLCLRGLCRRHGLPDVGFVSGLPPFMLLPWWRWIIALFGRRLPDRQRRRLVDTFRARGSAVVFLRRPAPSNALGSLPVEVDGVRLAAEAQGEIGGPVLALPTVFLWGEGAMNRLPQSLDFMFGTNEHPRLLRSLWLLVRRRSVHGAWVGDPLDLAAIRAERGVDDRVLAGMVRAGVGRGIELIRRNRMGSLTKPSDRVKAEVLASGRLRLELEAIAAEEGIPREEIPSRTRAILKALATDFKPRVLTLFAMVMSFVWRRIYTGLDVRPQDIENLRAAVGYGPLLILPDHRSHIDYMAISQMMKDANIMLPHIAAGENLSFWPLGWVFRSSGAFFIRRKFINDRFYGAVVAAYIRRLVQEGYAIEVFIEGGRSRTGKLLRPKLGMIEMALKALAVTPRRDLGILPTFIGYERVIEERSYVNESEGGKKKSEGVGNLLAAPKVLLHRYGRLHVRTGAFFKVQEILDGLGVSRADLLDGQTRRDVALEIALRTLGEVNRLCVVTPSAVLAAALLGFRGQRVRKAELVERMLALVGFLEAQGAELDGMVATWVRDEGGGAAHASLERTIAAFVRGGRLSPVRGDDGEMTFDIKAGQRLPIDYYKNNIIHLLAPAAIVALSILRRGGRGVREEEIAADVALACRLYRWEFLWPEAGDGAPSGGVVALVRRGLEPLLARGIVSSGGTVFDAIDEGRLGTAADALRNYHEIYLSALIVQRQRAGGDANGDPTRLVRAHFDGALEEGRYVKPEGASRINIQNALQSCKDLRLNRPAGDERPFDEGGLGDRLITLLESALR
jgi:glycerol-3-phosphate O-acyltransferase